MEEQERKPTKPCELCNLIDAVRGQRYCTGCKAVVLKQLRDAGYIDNRCIRHGTMRTRDHMEDQDETKKGKDR